MTNKTKVLLAGDLHGNPHALQQVFSKAHYGDCSAIIQVGDYGYGWSIGPDGLCDFSALTAEMVQQTGVPFYWLDGNHENFDMLFDLDQDENGHVPIADGVTYLSRGSNLVIGDTTFRAFGGAYSVDIKHRKPHVSWWPQEMVTDEDVARSISNGPADIFLSHDAPTGVQETAGLRRKLSQWGPQAAEKSIENQNRVRAALDACGAHTAYHGHLHQFYTCTLDSGTVVNGLNRDNDTGNFVTIEV